MKTRNRHLTAALTLTAALLLSGCATGITAADEEKAVSKVATADAKEALTGGEDLNKDPLVIRTEGVWKYDKGYAALFSSSGQGWTGIYSEYAAALYEKKDGTWRRTGDIVSVPAGQNAAAHPHQATCYTLSESRGEDTSQCDTITD